MDKELVAHFSREANKAFAFLTGEHGFSPPELQVDDQIHFAIVTFMGTNLAIECLLDERDEDVSCKVARVNDGKKTHHYAVDADGVRVRDYLSSILRSRGVPIEFTNVGRLSFYDRIPLTLSDYARMLKLHGQLIMDDNPAAIG